MISCNGQTNEWYSGCCINVIQTDTLKLEISPHCSQWLAQPLLILSIVIKINYYYYFHGILHLWRLEVIDDCCFPTIIQSNAQHCRSLVRKPKPSGKSLEDIHYY